MWILSLRDYLNPAEKESQSGVGALYRSLVDLIEKVCLGPQKP